MVVREWLRGGVDPERVERVAREAARLAADREDGGDEGGGTEVGEDDNGRPPADEGAIPVEPLEADNWLSMPVVVGERYLVKVTSRRNSLVHALFTAGRNLGAVSSGVEGFFEHHDDPAAMACHELAATRRIREAGVNAPRPVAAFEIDGLGVLASEYLPDPTPLSAVSDEQVRASAPAAFAALARMHDAGLAHGDVQAENLLLSAGELYVIDATNVRDDPGALASARAYDLASALATFAPRIGAREAVERARERYDDGDLLAAREFLPFVALRPDHEFDEVRVGGAVESAVDPGAEPSTAGPTVSPRAAAELDSDDREDDTGSPRTDGA